MVDKYVLDSTRLNPEASRLRFFLEGDPAAILMIELYGASADELTLRLAALEDELRREGFGYHRLAVIDHGEILVMGTLWLANAIRTEASLAFIGLGLKPPTPAWGGMIREGFENILDSAWLAMAPSVAILVVVFALNLLGDGLRDAIDPRLRNDA